MTGRQSWFEHWEPRILPIYPQQLSTAARLASRPAELVCSLDEAAILLPQGVKPEYCAELAKALDSTAKAVTAHAAQLSVPPEQFHR
jgi:hypothetical protein